METKTVLVTGIGGNVGQGVLRNISSLKKNIRIVGIDIASFTAGNHLCDITYKVPYAYDSLYITTIQAIVKKEKVDLIIPTTDYEVYYLSMNRSNIGTSIAASEVETAKKYLDKYLTYLHHHENNIPFAKSWLPKDYDGSCDEIILKPREGRGSRGVEKNPNNPKNYSDEFMIQPLHKGKEITTAFYIKKNGGFHGMFTMERELSNGATSKSIVTKKYDSEIMHIVEKMIAAGGLAGSINLQSIVDENEQIIPFEVNCRISGTNSIRHNLGFQDVKYTVQEYLYNEEPDEVKTMNGIAVRLLYDVIYPGATNETELNNNSSSFIVY